MAANHIDRLDRPHRAKSHTLVLVLLFFGMALALAGNVYQFVRGEHMKRDLALLEKSTDRQIAKLTDAAAAQLEENQQRFQAIKTQLQDATVAKLRKARSEVTRTSSQLQHRLDKVDSDLDQTATDLKHVVGDLGVLSSDVATNSKELSELKALGDRNYFEFDLTKAKQPQKVGDIRLLLKRTDPKRNRYTLDVLADDRTIEKKDKTINEPVQLYVSGSRQPYEIVVNQVKKNEAIGYLATPKVRVARGQASE